MSDTSNPKHAMGSAKVPMHLWPTSATAYGALGLYEGMLKYGRTNWRASDVCASIYVAALLRHMAAWIEGEDDTDEGAPHLGNALACLAILVDAKVNKTLIDDRNYVRSPDAHALMIGELTEAMRKLEKHFGDRTPKHWDKRDADKAMGDLIASFKKEDGAQLNLFKDERPETPKVSEPEKECGCENCVLNRKLAKAKNGQAVELTLAEFLRLFPDPRNVRNPGK